MTYDESLYNIKRDEAYSLSTRYNIAVSSAQK